MKFLRPTVPALMLIILPQTVSAQNGTQPFYADSIAAANETVCAIEKGTALVYCWGSNGGAALGVLGPPPIRSKFAVPAAKLNNYLIANPADGAAKSIMVAGSGKSTGCVRTLADKLLCWGSNSNGIAANSSMAPLPGIFDATANVGGSAQRATIHGGIGCMLTATNGVRCWGANDGGSPNHSLQGNLGVVTSGSPWANSALPVAAVPGVLQAIATTSGAFTCAIVNEPIKNVICWSANPNFGGATKMGGGPTPALMNGAALPQTYVEISPGLKLDRVRSLKVNGNTGCASTYSDKLYCWGLNATYGGVLGAPTSGMNVSRAKSLPVPFGGINRFSVGTYAVCVTTGPVNAVFCQGWNTKGHVGTGTIDGKYYTFDLSLATAPNIVHVNSPLPGLSHTQEIVSGAGFFCALRTGGDVWCWGDNANGQLGNNSMTASPLPVQVLK